MTARDKYSVAVCGRVLAVGFVPVGHKLFHGFEEFGAQPGAECGSVSVRYFYGCFSGVVLPSPVSANDIHGAIVGFNAQMVGRIYRKRNF